MQIFFFTVGLIALLSLFLWAMSLQRRLGAMREALRDGPEAAVQRASEQRFRFLHELGESTRTLTDPGEIMRISARQLGTHLRASRCAYADVEADGDAFTILHDYTDGCATTVGRYQLSRFGPRAAEAMRRGRTLVIADVGAELAGEDGAATFEQMGIKALICCPLLKGGQLRAMMAVHQTGPRAWTPPEIGLVEEVVERCWAIIERARAEADSRERIRLLAEVVSLQVWTADLEGALDFANKECGEYLSPDPTDILGTAWAQFVHPEDLPGALRSWQECLATGDRYEVEFRLRNRAGDYRWFLVRAQAMRDAAGSVVKWFGTNTDIHALKGAQTAAEEASRAKDAFLAALSHELRTPLTPVLMAATDLRRDERLPDDARQLLSMMERNISLEARLIDDLLDLTSIVQGKLQLRPKTCDAHSLISLAIEIIRDDAQAKGIAVERDFAAPQHGLIADPARFQQVIWNLLRNAVKFTPPGGRIAIRTANEHRGCLCIEISDSGIGIDPGKLETIFLPFEQIDPNGEHRFGGLGLGLAIARAIVDLHGGSIEATSEGPGQGATFAVKFPGPTEVGQGVAPSNPSMIDPPPLSPNDPKAVVRLLLVEDHQDSVEILSRLLKSCGYHVAIATTVAAALAKAAEETFDLVISDLGLPDGSGNELMEKLRDDYGLRGIALSGYGMEEDLERSRKAGFAEHLIKPVDFGQLAETISKLI